MEVTPSVADNKTKWKTVEELDYAGNLGLSPVHFKLELPEGYRDPGDFLRIHIQVKGQSDFGRLFPGLHENLHRIPVFLRIQ